VVATVRRPDDCINCQVGEYDMCLKGGYTERGIKGKHGFLSEYYADEEKFLVKVPEELGDMGVLLEPTSIAEKAVRTAFTVQNRMRWEPRTAMITGTGFLGLVTAMLLKLRGLDVISVDRSDDIYKDRIFSKLGILHFNTTKIDLHEIPHEIGRQIDIIVEMTGNSGVAMHAIMIAGTNSVVVLASITGGDRRIEICGDCFNQSLVLGNKTIVGIVNSHRRDFEQGIADLLAAENQFPGFLAKLITARYPPEKIHEALSSLDENIKVLIEF
jgi:threonine dehydrogenase-like Zn-dependent dehydrogenase